MSAVAVVPVKSLAHAKTRLALPGDQRRTLALAFALDTVATLSASPEVSGVLVVTSDPAVVCRLQGRRVRLTPDPGAGLQAAVHDGIGIASAWQPAARVIVVPADLACLRPDDVAQVLAAAGSGIGAFVPDRSATGTTLLIHPPGPTVLARYGPGSAARHRALGLLALTGAPVRCRHDVDTVEDLDAALRLGAGPETTAAALSLSRRWRPTR